MIPADSPERDATVLDTRSADVAEADMAEADVAEVRDASADVEPVDTAPGDDPRSDGGALDALTADGGDSDGSSPCGPCMEQWVCGGVVPAVLVNLVPMTDGCHLSGLSGDKLLQPDGTITEGGVVVGSIMRTTARVRVAYPDGGEWLYCASPPTCIPWS